MYLRVVLPLFQVQKTTTPKFLRHNDIIEKAHSFGNIAFDALAFNEDFSLPELKQALEGKTDSASGEGNISYSVLRNLPDKGLDLVLLQFNTVWAKMTFSQLLPKRSKLWGLKF